MSDGWLRDGLDIDEGAAGRIAAAVRVRIARRRRAQRLALTGTSLCAVLGVAVALALHRPPTNQTPGDTGVRAAAESARQPDTPHPTPGADLPVALSKVDLSVAVTWEGSPAAEYVVYRCDSPRFDTCSLADRVRGTQWVDGAPQSGTITYYRVEPRG